MKFRILHIGTADSTNTRLNEWAAGRGGPGFPGTPAPYTALWADTQSAGRGRVGRRFCSPEGGLYFSVYFPQDAPFDPGCLTPAAACAVCGALEAFGIRGLRVKWVNDVYFLDRKICGILCEGIPQGSVCGIGVNLRTPEGGFPPEAGNAGAPDGAVPDREALLRVILDRLDECLRPENRTALLSRYRALQYLTGRRVRCVTGNREIVGEAAGIAEDFSLLLRTDTGETVSVRSGEALLTRPAEE